MKTSAALALPLPSSGLDEVLETISRGFAPETELLPSAWTEQRLILPSVTTARPGPVQLSLIPYATDILDALAPESPYRLVVFMSSSQVAKTTIGIAWTMFNIDQRPGPLLIVQPTGNVAKRFAKQKIEPTIAATPCLAAKVRPARARDSGNTRLTKTFPNGMLHIAGANSPAELAEMSVRDEHLDEVDRFPPEVGDEGDPVEVASFRQETYEDGKTFMTSTPTVAGLSRIDLARRQCDVEMEFRVACLFCQHPQRLRFEQLRWPEGRPEEVGYECEACQQLIPHAKKRAFVRAGTWVPIRDNGRRESIGFHIWQAYSLIGKTSWPRIVAKYEKAKGKPALMRAFTNLVLGLPYGEQEKPPEWRPLYDRRESYEIGTVPVGGLLLVAGADVQANRVEVEVVAYARGLESWSVGYYVFMGDPSTLPDPTSPLRQEMDGLLAREWPCEGTDATISIRCLCMDAGYASTHVYAWARRHRQPFYGPAGSEARLARTVAAIKGDEGWGHIIKSASTSEEGNRKRGLRVYSVAKYTAFRELYDFLRLDPPTDAEREAGGRHPPGYCHFPEYDAPFFKQLTGPAFELKYDKKGHPHAAFVKDPSLPAEVPDCRTYARAAAALVGVERFRERDWRQLEGRRGGPAPVTTLVRPAPAPAAAVPVSSSPEGPPPVAPPPAPPRRRRRRSFVSPYFQRFQ